MLSYKQSQTTKNKIKPRNTVFYPISSNQQNSNQHAQDRRIFDTKLSLRQNQFCSKPHIPIIHGMSSSNQAIDSRNQQRIQQAPVFTNPTSPRTPREKLMYQQKKQCQSLNNSPTRQETNIKNQQIFTKTVQPIFSSSLSPKKENNESSIKNSLIPFQSSQNKFKKTLVLDLDETLIHSSQKKPDHFDLNFKIYSSTQKDEFFVCFRPGVQKFLKAMSQCYEIFIWTASIKEYADIIINQLDPQQSLISYRLYRESCIKKGECIVKDLAQLNRNIKDVIIIDNLSSCFKMHQENGIQIEDFIDNLQDNELEKLTPFLRFVSELQDVRDVFKWKIKFQNQSHFEYINMKNENKIFIQNQLANNHANPKVIAPFFLSEKQSRDMQNESLHKQQMNLTSRNESGKIEDSIYRNRRSVSNINNSTNISQKQEEFNKIQNLEHSFGGTQTIFHTDNQAKDNQLNPIFQEFTFSKIKIEESRLVKEQMSQTSDRVLEKNNQTNKHEKNSFKFLDQNYQYKDNINNSPEFNKTILQQQLYPQSKPFELFDSTNNGQQSQLSDRKTPSFERNGQLKENYQNQTSIYGSLSQNLKGLILEQKNKQTKQNSNNNSESSQRLSESSSNSTQPSSQTTPSRLNSTKCTQSTLQNENIRISFQNKQQFINLFQSDELVQSKNQQDTQNTTESINFKQESQPLRNQQFEYNIYQSHSIPKFLQLPSQQIDSQKSILNQKNDVQKNFTFETAKVQCEQKQQQIMNMLNNESLKLNSQLGNLQLKQQNKEVPQIKKDPSLQSVSMDQRRKTADNICITKSLNQEQQAESSTKKQKSYPKIFDSKANSQKTQNLSNQNIHVPMMSQNITLSQTQKNLNQTLNTGQMINKQEMPIKIIPNKRVTFQDENINNMSIQYTPQNEQYNQRRHASQHISNTQVQQYDQNNKQYINPQYTKQFLLDTNILKLSNKKHSVDNSTPSTASNSYSKDWENIKEKYPLNKIQCFEEYAVGGQIKPTIMKQQK